MKILDKPTQGNASPTEFLDVVTQELSLCRPFGEEPINQSLNVIQIFYAFFYTGRYFSSQENISVALDNRLQIKLVQTVQ